MICKRCNTNKPNTDFYWGIVFRQTCKKCVSVYQKSLREKLIKENKARAYVLYTPTAKYIVNDGKLVNEHRWIMEQHLGRQLEAQERVKHLNGDIYDNDLENLKIKPFLHLDKTK